MLGRAWDVVEWIGLMGWDLIVLKRDVGQWCTEDARGDG